MTFNFSHILWCLNFDCVLVTGFGDDGIQLTNEAIFFNCTFKRNAAVDYGAALSLAAVIFLRDSSSVKTVVITDR